MNPELWVNFANARGDEEFCRYWLEIQCSILSNVIQGVIILREPGKESYSPFSKWPEEGEDPERLTEISERVIEEQCGLLVELKPTGPHVSISPSRFGVAYPIIIEEQLLGLVAMEIMAGSEEQLKHVMEQLQWGISWLEVMFRRQRESESKASFTRLKSAVDILAIVLSEKAFESACMSFVTEMATVLDCDRVSMGFLRGKKVRIQAISHSSQVGERMNLIRAVGMAMDEAILQRRDIYYPHPPGKEMLITRDHELLAKQHGAGSVLTIPFYGEDRYYGALTLERPRDRMFNDEEARYCHSVASLVFPVLETKRQTDRNLILQFLDALKDQALKLFGPRYPGRKLLAILILAVAAFFSFKTGDYRISADTVLEGKVRRVVIAPFDGYIKSATIRAGDLVEEGSIMCILDDRDLRLERLNWLSQQTQYERQYQEAQAKHNRAEANIIKAQLDQAKARLELMESRLERTVIQAPFKGLVLSGDLSQRLGGSVEKGEVLFEVAPLEEYRVILEVDERRIADVKKGQKGQIILSALPNDKFAFVIEKVTPISNAKEGLNYFRVEARPETISERFRPGMEGVGKIHVDRRKLISIWTRNLREWLILWKWSWLP
ncbi:MAG: HlyD family efflux transporter periplasmic adaptor subunit [Deltaproteobacteria bacterium]|nr:HlyD family efflux transporter periplasmic adaptor subunit [Deltaproteobacteria bacterium]